MNKSKQTEFINDMSIIDEIESVRSTNNINWMNILRLAFKYAPEEARELTKQINDQDQKISVLLEKLSKKS